MTISHFYRSADVCWQTVPIQAKTLNIVVFLCSALIVVPLPSYTKYFFCNMESPRADSGICRIAAVWLKSRFRLFVADSRHYKYTDNLYSVDYLMNALTLEQNAVLVAVCGSLIPLIGNSVPAGFPSPSADYVETPLDVQKFLVTHQAASFFMNVKGDSMIGAHICDGDKILVDRSLTPKSGDIVVAIINNEYTLKRLYIGTATMELRPENPNYQPQQMKEGDELDVWGVVSGLMRKIRS